MIVSIFHASGINMASPLFYKKYNDYFAWIILDVADICIDWFKSLEMQHIWIILYSLLFLHTEPVCQI